MNWSIIHPRNTFKLKRLLNILCNFAIYSKEEIKYITAPITGARLQAICPTYCWVKHLSII